MVRVRVGLRKTSLVDYPGKLAAVLFFPGCNLRCPWCHNPELVAPTDAEFTSLISFEEVVPLLEKRKAMLRGVVLSGGEPLLFPDIGMVISCLKRHGYAVKLDTNGTMPERLLPLLANADTRPDYIAVDLKAEPGRYNSFAEKSAIRPPSDYPVALSQTAHMLRTYNVAGEFRSLVFSDDFFSLRDVEILAPLTVGFPWFFSAFRGGTCLDAAWNSKPSPTRAQANRIVQEAINRGANAHLRGI